jgi:hypothetical protein
VRKDGIQNRTKRGITLKNCECNLSHGSSRTRSEHNGWKITIQKDDSEDDDGDASAAEKCVTSLSYNLLTKKLGMAMRRINLTVVCVCACREI